MIYTEGPDDVIVGGAMFPQCFPRRSAFSLSPSRISIKSYLPTEEEKKKRVTLRKKFREKIKYFYILTGVLYLTHSNCVTKPVSYGPVP